MVAFGMHKLKLPNGSTLITLSSNHKQQQRVIDERHAFGVKYCTEHGWPTDAAQLTIDQIMEIRAQDGWKNAGQS